MRGNGKSDGDSDSPSKKSEMPLKSRKNKRENEFRGNSFHSSNDAAGNLYKIFSYVPIMKILPKVWLIGNKKTCDSQKYSNGFLMFSELKRFRNFFKIKNNVTFDFLTVYRFHLQCQMGSRQTVVLLPKS